MDADEINGVYRALAGQLPHGWLDALPPGECRRLVAAVAGLLAAERAGQRLRDYQRVMTYVRSTGSGSLALAAGAVLADD